MAASLMDETRARSRRWVIRASLLAAALISALAPFSPQAIERWFSTTTYPRVQRVLTPLSNAIPVAWLDVLSVAAIAWLIWTWWRAIRRTGERVWPRIVEAAAQTITTAAVVYLAYMLLWGFNYRRVPMTQRLEVRREAPSTEEAVRLGREAVTHLNGMHAAAHNAGWIDPWRDAALIDTFRTVQRQLADAPSAVPGRLKRTLYGPFFRWSAVDGMVNPFGLEVLANPDLLPFERPFVAAHEWAHLAGYADESEANFVGWLACVRGDLRSQYSGWLYLYWQIAGELPAKERELIASDLRDGPRADLHAIIARLRRGDLPLLRRASWQMYDSFLKANRVEAGVRSYGAVVTLILRARFEPGWLPVRRTER